MLSRIWRGFTIMATTEKKAKKIIGTHDGVFHCDEALACFMIKLLPQFKDAEIIRTREHAKLSTCDIVVDVGAEYDPQKNKYDHHQQSFKHTLTSILPDIAKNRFIKLSSAGLIYAHFGFEIIQQILSSEKYAYNQEELERIYLAVYDGFIEEIDAIDNGVPMCEGTPKYRIDTHLSARVQVLNPDWNDVSNVDISTLFEKAMHLVGEEFISKVKRIGTIWYPARKLVKESIDNRKKVHESGHIIELSGSCPWKQHLMDIEEEMNIKNEIKFVIFHENTNDTWRVQGVPIQPDSFICRVFLHKDWRGIRDEDLSKISGISNCIFCHTTGFIGGNKTREGVLKMALRSLEAQKS